MHEQKSSTNLMLHFYITIPTKISFHPDPPNPLILSLNRISNGYNLFFIFCFFLFIFFPFSLSLSPRLFSLYLEGLGSSCEKPKAGRQRCGSAIGANTHRRMQIVEESRGSRLKRSGENLDPPSTASNMFALFLHLSTRVPTFISRYSLCMWKGLTWIVYVTFIVQ